MHWHWDVPLFELAISIPPYLAWFSFNPFYNNRDGPALCWPLYPAFLLLLSLTTPPIAPQAGQAPQGPSSFLFDSPFIIFSFLILLPSSFSLSSSSSSSLLLFSSPLLLLFFPLLFPSSLFSPYPPRRSIEKPPEEGDVLIGRRVSTPTINCPHRPSRLHLFLGCRLYIHFRFIFALIITIYHSMSHMWKAFRVVARRREAGRKNRGTSPLPFDSSMQGYMSRVHTQGSSRLVPRGHV